MKKYLQISIISIMLLGTAIFSAFAFTANAKNLDDTRPGWGHGDKNHVHTGPPGQSVVIPPFSI